MRFWQKGISIFAIITISLTICACGSNDSQDTPEPQESQTFEVQRGNLTTMISAFGNVSMPHRANLSFGVGGTIEELKVDFGEVVKAGDTLASLDTSSLERSVARAEADLRIMQINFERASSDISILQAQAALESAQTTLASTEEALRQSQDFSILDAQTDLENAQRNLITTQKNAEISIAGAEELYESVREIWGDFMQANVESLHLSHFVEQKNKLWEDVEEAGKNLEIVRETTVTSIANAELAVTATENALVYAPLGIEEGRAAVANARAALIKAENDLVYVQAGLDIELLQINIDKALISVEEAHDRLNDATIIAPIDGTIADVNVIVGDEVIASTVVMYLVDTSQVEVDADVDEIDVAKVGIGQAAEISIDAVSGIEFPGEVTAVTPVGRNQAGLITYDITIGINDTKGANLKDGMTASADVIALLAENAVLIPKAAISKDRATGIQTVTVVADDDKEEVREVQTGVSSSKLTEITEGLEEGEQIVSSVSVTISGGSSSGDRGGAEDVDPMECVGKIMGNKELTDCFEKMMEMGEEMGMDESEFGDGIPWDQIEQYANDDTGEVPDDIKQCLETMLENRACLDALAQMAEDMGIDPNQYSGGMGGM